MQAHSDPTYTEFSSQPVPAGFFGPGSDPFTNRVDLQGLPLQADPSVGNCDTIIERLAPLSLLFGESGTIPIKIAALSLVSTAPITVTYSDGQPAEAWNVRMALSSSHDQPQGTATITRDANGTGGSFVSLLPVLPRVVFVRVSDQARRVIDFGESGLPAIELTNTNGCWSATAVARLNLGRSAEGLMVDHDGDPATSPVGPLPGTARNFFPGVKDGEIIWPFQDARQDYNHRVGPWIEDR